MNGLPGATTRLGAILARRGLSASQSWMRADSHDGPEQRLHHEAEYIDAALMFVSLPTSSCDARPDHTKWHKRGANDCQDHSSRPHKLL